MVGILETIINQVILNSSYQSLTGLWRTKEELGNFAPIFLGIYLVFSGSITYLFHHTQDQMNWMKGLKLGIALGLISRFWYAYTNFIVLPIPSSLAFGWFILGTLELAIIGSMLGFYYSKKSLK